MGADEQAERWYEEELAAIRAEHDEKMAVIRAAQFRDRQDEFQVKLVEQVRLLRQEAIWRFNAEHSLSFFVDKMFLAVIAGMSAGASAVGVFFLAVWLFD